MLSGRKEHGRESQRGGGHIDVGGMYVHGEHSHRTSQIIGDLTPESRCRPTSPLFGSPRKMIARGEWESGSSEFPGIGVEIAFVSPAVRSVAWSEHGLFSAPGRISRTELDFFSRLLSDSPTRRYSHSILCFRRELHVITSLLTIMMQVPLHDTD